MKFLLSTVMLVSAALAPMQAAGAATVVDQSQQVARAGFSFIQQDTPTAQTFVPTMNNSVGAGVHISDQYGSYETAPISISLWTGLPSDASSVMLAKADVLAVKGQWVDATWAAVSLIAGNVYNIRLSGNNDAVVSYGDPYAFGQTYYFGAAYPSFDLTFRTFADDSYSTGGAVPEPASWAMMIGGFGMVGAAMRRRAVRTTTVTA